MCNTTYGWYFELHKIYYIITVHQKSDSVWEREFTRLLVEVLLVGCRDCFGVVCCVLSEYRATAFALVYATFWRSPVCVSLLFEFRFKVRFQCRTIRRYMCMPIWKGFRIKTNILECLVRDLKKRRSHVLLE